MPAVRVQVERRIAILAPGSNSHIVFGVDVVEVDGHVVALLRRDVEQRGVQHPLFYVQVVILLQLGLGTKGPVFVIHITHLLLLEA